MRAPRTARIPVRSAPRARSTCSRRSCSARRRSCRPSMTSNAGTLQPRFVYRQCAPQRPGRDDVLPARSQHVGRIRVDSRLVAVPRNAGPDRTDARRSRCAPVSISGARAPTMAAIPGRIPAFSRSGRRRQRRWRRRRCDQSERQLAGLRLDAGTGHRGLRPRPRSTRRRRSKARSRSRSAWRGCSAAAATGCCGRTAARTSSRGTGRALRPPASCMPNGHLFKLMSDVPNGGPQWADEGVDSGLIPLWVAPMQP